MLKNDCIMPRKLFYIIHAGNIFQIYRGCTKRLGPGLIDITFFMLNLDPLNTVLILHFYDDPHHTKDFESCSQGNMPLGQCWGCIYAIGPKHQQLPRYASDHCDEHWLTYGVIWCCEASWKKCSGLNVRVTSWHGNAFHSTGLFGAESTGHRPVVWNYESDLRQPDHIVT